MPIDLGALLALPESEQFEKKGERDPSNPREILGLVADIVSMANSRGGRILIGSKGKSIPNEHFPLFDSARLDDKVNTYVEPRVEGIESICFGADFVLIGVKKSRNPPHVFKKDGTFETELKKQASVFRRSEIFVRHSSKTERASRSDLDRMFGERQRELLEKVTMVFEAPPDANIRIESGSALAVRIDPGAPEAKPVYDLLTPEPFRDLEQELVGAVKAWKTSRQLLNEMQIFKAYREREKISDPEVLEVLLKSCWEHYLPGYWWAGKIAPKALLAIISVVIKADAYPASSEAAKVASLLPRPQAKSLIRLGEDCTKVSLSRICKRSESVIRTRSQKHLALARLIHPGTRLRYRVGQGTKEVELNFLSEGVFDEILGTLVAGVKENRGAFKTTELIVYGAKLTEIKFPDEGEAATI